jgi:hypothetical protein
MSEDVHHKKTFLQKLYESMIPLLAGSLLGMGSWVMDINSKVQRHEEFITRGDRFSQQDADMLIEKVLAMHQTQAELRTEVTYLNKTVNKTIDVLEKILLERRNLKLEEK